MAASYIDKRVKIFFFYNQEYHESHRSPPEKSFQFSYLFGTCTFSSFLHNKTLLCFVPSKSDGWGRSIGVTVLISPKNFNQSTEVLKAAFQ